MITTDDIPEDELAFSAIRASGPGGQNVNKVSSAIHLKFDIAASSLPLAIKHRLSRIRDQRIGKDGVITIKAQKFRSQEKNRADALARLDDFLKQAQKVEKVRKETKPSKSSVRKRLDNKRKHGERKKMRGKVGPDY